MNSSNETIDLSKAVLNVTVHEYHPGNEFVDIQKYVSIDITDLLKENGVECVYAINGISALEKECVMQPVPEDYGLDVMFAVGGMELRCLEKRICNVIDAAIVNEKQSKAIKKLIHDEFEDFHDEHWEPIKKCDFTKDYYDNLFNKEFEGLVEKEIEKNK